MNSRLSFTTFFVLSLSLVLLPSGRSLAQSASPPPDVETAPARRVLRVPVGLLAAGATLTLTVVGGTVAACGSGDGDSSSVDGSDEGVPTCPLVMGPTTYALGIAGIAPLVYGLGTLLDGDGGLGWTYLGTGIGAAVGALASFGILASDSDDSAVLFALAALAPPVIGAVIAYEASSHESRAFAARGGARSASLRIVPTVGPV
ncbi:MAG: hypothetical protein IT379_00285, partial [Deltaproteobacteria bacterium]|nr:hypothetical protein [Deltaproteobacteria bacterium]